MPANILNQLALSTSPAALREALRTQLGIDPWEVLDAMSGTEKEAS